MMQSVEVTDDFDLGQWNRIVAERAQVGNDVDAVILVRQALCVHSPTWSGECWSGQIRI